MQVTIIDVAAKPMDAGQLGEKRARPSIGLVLGSGAARGFAHIGVMHALSEHGIRPDIIVGTSIGALVGGCYANNQLEELEAWARSLTRRRIIGYLDVRIGGSGLIGGGRLAQRLEEAIGDAAIEDLPIRFAAIATEVGTGHEIWLTRGALALAMRASYALPGIFPPVRLGGRWLVDGALVNPVPVSAARALARASSSRSISTPIALPAAPRSRATARMRTTANRRPTAQRIAGLARHVRHRTDAQAPNTHSDARPGFSTVMIEAFNIMQDRLTRMRLAGDPPDVHITPHIGHIGWLDFHRAADAIAIGQGGDGKGAGVDRRLDRRARLRRKITAKARLRTARLARELCVEQLS